MTIKYLKNQKCSAFFNLKLFSLSWKAPPLGRSSVGEGSSGSGGDNTGDSTGDSTGGNTGDNSGDNTIDDTKACKGRDLTYII